MTPRLTLPLLLAACSAAPAEGTGEPATTTTATTTAATDPAPTSSPPPTTGGADGSADADATAAHTGDDDTTTTTTGEPTDTTDASSSTGEPPVDVRRETLVTYAPRVWLHPGEQYFPSSVEFAFASMTRFPDGDGQHWIRSTEELASASDTLPFFAGDLAGAPVYAFWAEKAPDIVDLVYFFWYPYHRPHAVQWGGTTWLP
jgi:hypothetical protein